MAVMVRRHIMNAPTPIDNDTLPSFKSEAVECWQFNEHKAMDRLGPNDPVKKVWATRSILYSNDPSGSEYTSGSQRVGILYKTEADAWAACLVAVRKSFDERMRKLEAMAKEASDRQETHND